MKAEFGHRVVSERTRSIIITGDSGDMTGSSSSILDALPAALPYFGAALGWIAGDLLLAFIRSAP